MLTHHYAAVLERFGAALVDDTLAPDEVTAATRNRMDIYRNNVRVNRIAALSDAFANIVQLVGLDYFSALARAYVECTPAQ